MPWRLLSFTLLCCLSGLFRQGFAQNSSALAQGRWYKIGVTQSGVYKLSASFLKDKGILTASDDPRLLQLRGYGGGMLPEAIAAPRPQDLPQLPIQFTGDTDGRLDNSDYVLFYAQGPDALHFDAATGWFKHQKNLYSDTAYYFVALGTSPGLRLKAAPNMGLQHPAVTHYEAVEVYEKDLVNIISSGRRWFGEALGYTPSLQFNTAIQELAAGTLRLRTAFVNTGQTAVSLNVAVNGMQLQQYALRAVSPDTYANKGWIEEKESSLPTTGFNTGTPLQLQLSISGANSNSTYLDYFLLQASAPLKYHDKQLSFIAPQSLQQPMSTYQLAAAPADLQVWNVTNPLQARQQEVAHQNNLLLFGDVSAELQHYVAFRPASAPEPVYFGQVARQNLQADLSPQLLIVTHPSLLPEAERLAAFRSSHDGLSVKVVTTQQVYHEFSSGRQDVTAIRDYVRYLYKAGGGRLQYLLLFGRGYYDYKNRTSNAFNLVPLYESYNSTHPINSYASDDFYGFLEEHEGAWAENEAGNQTLEVGIGRLPVVSLQEARQVVDKLIRYSSHAATFGNWRQRICFVADDDDGNIHQLDAERLASIVASSQTLYNSRKLYLDAFPKVVTANSQSSPKAKEALQNAINQGALIVNYTGHGSYRYWTYENIFSQSMAEQLQNEYRLPLFVTATCEFGLHDGQLRSGAESLLLNPKGGAIGLLTTARPVFSYTNLKINSAFYRNAFPASVEEVRRLGDIVRLTKNEGVPGTGINNRNFILLGDPSMQLAYPRQEAVITSIKSSSGSTDTLKAFDQLRIAGQILNEAKLADASFNGSVQISVYDKSDVLQTLGQSDPSITYRQRQNVLYRATATVKEGVFSFDMAVPKNIKYNIGLGRIELYAVHENGQRDAAGATEHIKVGGSSSTKSSDNNPPQIWLYLNDTSFVAGNPVDQQAMLLARLQDESGINISYAGIAQNIEARLDDSITYVLNDYYTSEKGSFKSGWLRFPLYKLEPGRHHIVLQAWDTHGNMSQQQIDFFVPGNKGISIAKATNYPNPFQENTTFAITHSRAGDDLEVEISIYNTDGRLMQQLRQNYAGAYGTLHLAAAPLQHQSLKNGLYLYKVLVRSLTDGSVAEKTEKLLILR